MADFVRLVVWTQPLGDHWIMYGVSQWPVGGGAGTVYLTTGFDDTEGEISFPVARAMRVLKFNVEASAAPGVGQAFTYRVRRKPAGTGQAFADTGLGAVVSGTSVAAEADGSVDFPRGSRFCIALDKTAGVPAAKHSWSVEYAFI